MINNKLMKYELLPLGAGLQSQSVEQKDTKTALSLQPLHWGISNSYILHKWLIIADFTYLLNAVIF